MFTMRAFGDFLDDYKRYVNQLYPGKRVDVIREGFDCWEIKLEDIGFHSLEFISKQNEFLKICLYQELSKEHFAEHARALLQMVRDSEMDIFISIEMKNEERFRFKTSSMMDIWIPTGENTENLVGLTACLEGKTRLGRYKQYVYIPSANKYHNNTKFICNINEGLLEVYVGEEKYDVCKDKQELNVHLEMLEKENEVVKTIEREENGVLTYGIHKKIINYRCIYELRVEEFDYNAVYETVDKEKMIEELKKRNQIVENKKTLRKQMEDLIYEMDAYSYRNRRGIQVFEKFVRVQSFEDYNEKTETYKMDIHIDDKGEKQIYKEFTGEIAEVKEETFRFVEKILKEKRLKYVVQNEKTHMNKVKDLFREEAGVRVVYENGAENEKQKIDQELGVFFQQEKGMPVIENKASINKIDLPHYEIKKINTEIHVTKK